MTRDCPHCHRPMPEPHGAVCNDDARIVMHDGTVSESMTNREYAVLCYLVRRFGQWCTNEQLADSVYRNDLDPPLAADVNIRTHICRVRQKLQPSLQIESTRGSDRGWRIITAPAIPSQHDAMKLAVAY